VTDDRIHLSVATVHVQVVAEIYAKCLAVLGLSALGVGIAQRGNLVEGPSAAINRPLALKVAVVCPRLALRVAWFAVLHAVHQASGHNNAMTLHASEEGAPDRPGGCKIMIGGTVDLQQGRNHALHLVLFLPGVGSLTVAVESRRCLQSDAALHIWKDVLNPNFHGKRGQGAFAIA